MNHENETSLQSPHCFAKSFLSQKAEQVAEHARPHEEDDHIYPAADGGRVPTERHLQLQANAGPVHREGAHARALRHAQVQNHPQEEVARRVSRHPQQTHAREHPTPSRI